MKGTFSISLILIVLLSACREPFQFNYDEVANPKLVVDGFITDEGRQHTVSVSYSTNINDRGLVETRFVADALVRIEDSQGSFTQLTHSRSGIYLSQPQYAAIEGNEYKLIVTLTNGEQYESPLKRLPPASPADIELSVTGATRPTLINNRIQDEPGARVTTMIGKDAGRHFYQWKMAHYYLFNAEQAPFFNPDYQFCYVRDFDEAQIDLIQDEPLEEGVSTEYEQELDFIPVNGNMRLDFGVEARLLTMAETDYNYWERAKRLTENTGGLFDAAPFSLEGNITNTSTGELALGYFGVYRESFDREFFVYSDLGFPPVEYLPCSIPPGATFPHPCMDCRVAVAQENFGTIRPLWWRN